MGLMKLGHDSLGHTGPVLCRAPQQCRRPLAMSFRTWPGVGAAASTPRAALWSRMGKADKALGKNSRVPNETVH